MRRFVPLTMLWAFLAVSMTALADVPPECLSKSGDPIPAPNNGQVLEWKRTTPNQYLDRARVLGTVEKDYGVRNDHEHFSVRIGPKEGDTVEVVYNRHFGELPPIRVGMQIEACGDYITSNASTPQYPPSPDRALVHWVHQNPRNRGHAHGWVFIEGRLYGWL